MRFDEPLVAVGIDPGATGAVAFLFKDAAYGLVLDTADPTAVSDALRPCKGARVGIERVQSWSAKGSAGAFRFGTSWGVPQGAATAFGLSLTLVLPRAWQAVAFAGRGRPKDRDEIKAISVVSARARWPGFEWPRAKKEQSALADALWIAEWIRRDGLGVNPTKETV